jgi:hypothetical protein
MLENPWMASTIEKIYLDPILDGPERSGVVEMAEAWEIRSKLAKRSNIRAAYKTAFEDLAAAKRLANVEKDDALPPKMYDESVTALLAVCGNAEVVRG